MSKRVDDLLQEWVRCDQARQDAHDALHNAALEEFKYKVGATIAIIGSSLSGVGRKVGKITKIGFGGRARVWE